MQIPDRSIYDSKDSVIRLNVPDIISHVYQGSLPSCRLFTIHTQGFLISNSVPHMLNTSFFPDLLPNEFLFTYVVSTHKQITVAHLKSTWNEVPRSETGAGGIRRVI